jgi:hypothetical protein
VLGRRGDERGLRRGVDHVPPDAGDPPDGCVEQGFGRLWIHWAHDAELKFRALPSPLLRKDYPGIGAFVPGPAVIVAEQGLNREARLLQTRSHL